jgi:hypothetical protein
MAASVLQMDSALKPKKAIGTLMTGCFPERKSIKLTLCRNLKET